MPITPEDLARQNIDKLLSDSGWIIQDRKAANPSAGRGVAIREFPLKKGHGEADYLLYVDGMLWSALSISVSAREHIMRISKSGFKP